MTTTVDLEALAASSAPGVTLLGNTVVESAGTGDSFSDFSTLQRIYVQAEARLRSALYGAGSLTVLVEQSSNGTDWTTAATFTFGPDGKQGTTITGPITYLRARWTVGNRSEWALVFVKAFPGIFDESGGSGGGGGDAVSSVFGRIGAVAATSGDYTASQVGALASTSTLDAIAGANAAAGNVSLNSHKLTNVSVGTASTDAATLANSLSAFAAPSADISMGSHKVTNVGTGSSSTDAATLSNHLNQFATPAANLDMNAHKVTNAADGTDAADLATVGQLPTDIARAVLGTVSGVTVEPASMPTPLGPELWVLANFRTGFNVSTTTPSVTGNSTDHSLRTVVSLGNIVNCDLCYRLKLNVAAFSINGGGYISTKIVDAGGTILANSQEQYILTSVSPSNWTGPWQMDFKINPTWGTGTAYLDVTIRAFNNSTSGTLSIDGVSLREVAAPQRPMSFAFPGSGVNPSLFVPLYDTVAGSYRMVRHQFGTSNASGTDYMNLIDGYNVGSPFRYDGADPDFVRTTGSSANPIGTGEIVLAAGEFTRSMRIGNDDQVLEVLKQDGTTYELRCNTHGGETLPSPVTFQYDPGDGSWVSWDGTGNFLRNVARRFQFIFNTLISRSAPDSDSFATTTHTATYFADGMMRMDRATTFTKDMRLRSHFEWMSSHSLTSPKVGRIGVGLLVLDEIDIFAKIAAPAAPTLSTSTSGGSLAAATYAYTVTALGPGGETTAPTAATQATTGTTSTVTVSWTGVSNATGYRVYGRINASGTQELLTTVGPTTTSWVDDGTTAQQGGFTPPNVNTARRLDQTTEVTDSVVSDRATWAVWYDPIVNICFGNIYDRDTVVARTNVAGVKMRMEAVTGSIVKNYLNVYWDGDGSPSLPLSETQAVLNGTVWTATHWAYTYVPADPKNYHLEIAYRALNLTGLADAYPST